MSYHTAYRPDAAPAMPIGDLVDLMGVRNDELDRLLGTQGPLAAAMGPRFKDRPMQRRMAQDVWRALDGKRHLAIEAGTGTGKSLGYLVPAILHAVDKKEAIVVATASIALQDQLQQKDLPFLRDNLGIHFSWSVLKGRGNYFCEAKNAEVDLEFQEEMEQIHHWLQRTRTGDLGELPFDITQEHLLRLRMSLIAEPEDCPGKMRCPVAAEGSCWFYNARRRAEQAHIIVVNHALLAIDLQMGGLLLPPHRAVIIDEAHQFEDWVRDMTEATLSASRMGRLAKKVARICTADLKRWEQACGEFFSLADQHVRKLLPGPTGSIGLQHSDLPRPLLEAAVELADAMDSIQKEVESLVESEPKAEGIASSIAETKGHIQGLHQRNNDWVLWGEARNPQKQAALKLTMVDVADWLRIRLFRERTVVLASATLATGEGEAGFTYLKEALGIDQCRTLQVDSPFDYRAQSLYYLPDVSADLHDRRAGEDWRAQAARTARELAPHMRQVLDTTKGRAFVLFTSYEVLNQCANLLQDLPYPMARQGHMSKQATVEWFKTTPGAVLFATSSFWEGVDIPGDALSCVIIDKIPFPGAQDPVWAAREERVGRRNAFTKLRLPAAITALKQGVGRLIRSESDRGLLVLLDPRLTCKGYGKTILRALPGDPSGKRLRQGDLAGAAAFLAPRRAAQSPAELWAVQALLTLAGLDPDFAAERNGVGFDASDTRIGHALARLVAAGQDLTDRQWSASVELCAKYHKQVGPVPVPEQEVA